MSYRKFKVPKATINWEIFQNGAGSISTGQFNNVTISGLIDSAGKSHIKVYSEDHVYFMLHGVGGKWYNERNPKLFIKIPVGNKTIIFKATIYPASHVGFSENNIAGEVVPISTLRHEYILTCDSQEVESILRTIGHAKDIGEYHCLFVKINNGAYSEVWGTPCSVPYLSCYAELLHKERR